MQTLSYQLFVKRIWYVYDVRSKKHKVTLLMFIETIILGATSLLIGITIGVGLAEGIGQLLMKQLEFAGEGYKAFYLPSIAITCIFFFALFVLSAIMNSIKLSRISVLQLVHADEQTERVAIKGKMPVVVAFLGILLLGIGYASLIYISYANSLIVLGLMAVGLISATVGTYLIFGSLLPVMINKLKSNKKRSEKGLNAFTFAQLNFRINSLTNVLATVAILVALGAGGIACGMAFKNNILKLQIKYKFTIQSFIIQQWKKRQFWVVSYFKKNLNIITKLMIDMFIILKKM